MRAPSFAALAILTLLCACAPKPETTPGANAIEADANAPPTNQADQEAAQAQAYAKEAAYEASHRHETGEGATSLQRAADGDARAAESAAQAAAGDSQAAARAAQDAANHRY